MTDIYVEVGKKKAIAWSPDWPGWCRIRRGEEEAVRALAETEARYYAIARRAGMTFAPGDLAVAERLPGDANTDWGVPSALAAADTRPIAAEMARRNAALLRASWELLDEAVAAAPAQLRKGPRGGGRDRDALWRHVVEAERAYARKIGVRHPPFDASDHDAVVALRDAIAAVLGRPSGGGPLVEGGWRAGYAVRRMAWHVVDHLWELEDRRG